jgi:hypothetical protein
MIPRPQIHTLFVSAAALVASSLGAQDYGRPCSLRQQGPDPILFSEDPAPGIPFAVSLALGAPQDLSVLALGTSRSAWGPLSLPLDLSGAGLQGCSLLAEPLLFLPPQYSVGGYALWNFPALQLPVGTELFAQGLCFAPDLSGITGLSQGRKMTFRELRNYRIVAIPDTQFYSQYPAYFPSFQATVQWAANNASTIDFVTHLGDLVQNGSRFGIEWSRAHQAMAVLDGVVPYNACLGNHDYDLVGNRTAATSYMLHFGPRRYQSYTWFVGTSPDGRSMAQLIPAGGKQYLHFSMEWRPDDEDLAWAMETMRKFPRTAVIVATHEHLGTGNPASRRSAGETLSSSGTNSGEDVYRKLVEPFPQVCVVLCGHIHGTGRIRTTTELGQPVHEILSDYQSDPNGGNGWFRVMDFQPKNNRIVVSTRSQTYQPGTTSGPNHATSPASNFTLSFDFEAHAQMLDRRTLHFRQGQDLGHGVYTGTQDTVLGDGTQGSYKPNLSYGQLDTLRLDGDADHEQSLLRFDGIVGNGPGQIRPGTKVRRAILTLTTESSNAESGSGGKFYRMKQSWSELSTWNNIGGGVLPANRPKPSRTSTRRARSPHVARAALTLQKACKPGSMVHPTTVG